MASGARKRTLTLQDVAKKAGVSQATVSLVLNGVAGVRVSEQTQQRVIDAADALGYRRAVRLRADERFGSVIGLIIDDIAASPFATPLLEGAREAAWEHQCVVSTISTRNHPPLEQAAVQSMLAIPVIGIIYATLLTRAVTVPTIGRETPFVMLNCYDGSGTYSSALPDDVGGARTMTRALLTAGHVRVGHLAGETWLDAARDRHQGYREALAAHDLPYDPELVQNFGSSVGAGKDGTHALLDLANPPTGVFCFNDRMALGALEAARERGLRVPGELSIVGFDNDPFASSLFPGGLTTAELPHENMARWAVEQIIQMRHAKRMPHPRQKSLPCPIVRRHSIARYHTPA